MKFELFIVALMVAVISAQNPKCSEHTGEEAVHIPHETDCTKFYVCDPEGNLIPMDCDAGLEFNPILGSCDWPNGLCHAGTGTTVKSNATEKPEEPEEPEVLPEGCDPNEDPETPTLLPHPTKCEYFYMCDEGTPILFKCPEGEHWNIELNYCDWIDQAHCVRPIPK